MDAFDADFFAADFLAVDCFLVDFFAVDFFAADFFAVDFFAADFFVPDFFPADPLATFFRAGFAAFLASDFAADCDFFGTTFSSAVPDEGLLPLPEEVGATVAALRWCTAIPAPCGSPSIAIIPPGISIGGRCTDAPAPVAILTD
jgi:hypothetical protein